ncbi:hypothetical protein NMY3_01017 [Candidatus Nitrosocosmicus oleophilus]|jgi:hypothetical protein|uniref:Uncharacterized protein n=1 Tax=Candidatus Nitrosocosmicus oleophilus TaxID=1353260 RepID=A0A654M6V6_9ARCH|nr:hypothetical protein [Candidatus Nitrosocosmicus oleophilus]ALI35222.1 hypothetical protein NMY3_01017 [Candidatus Nitrosocosmicus oleophilus]
MQVDANNCDHPILSIFFVLNPDKQYRLVVLYGLEGTIIPKRVIESTALFILSLNLWVRNSITKPKFINHS